MSVNRPKEFPHRCRENRVLRRLGWLSAFTVLSNLLTLGAPLLLAQEAGTGNFGTDSLAPAATNIVTALARRSTREVVLPASDDIPRKGNA